jgi:hypothetical protein
MDDEVRISISHSGPHSALDLRRASTRSRIEAHGRDAELAAHLDMISQTVISSSEKGMKAEPLHRWASQRNQVPS